MPTDKATRNRQNAASRARYEAKAYDKALIRFKAGELDAIRAAADAAGESLNGYITQAVRDRMNTGK